MPAPPHVFEISKRWLRYGCFERRNGSLDSSLFHQEELPADLFQEGPLGGPLRERDAFGRLVESVLQVAGTSITKASLLLPDDWLRTLTLDTAGAERVGSLEEFLRFRLKKLVPFRVEDLRVRGIADMSLRGSEDSRVLVGFAVDQLLGELEGAFAEHGVRLGLITNRSLAVAWALSDLEELRCVTLLDEDGYSLVFVLAGRVVLLRHKALDPSRLGNGLETVVRRDLRITRGYLSDELPEHPLTRSLLCGSVDSEATWLSVLEDCLGVPAVRLGDGDLRPISGCSQPWDVLAPLAGAAALEIS